MIVKASDKSRTHLTPKVFTGDSNEVFHSKCDYGNKILKNVTGTNAVNSAAGIMFQESKTEIEGIQLEQTFKEFKKQSFKLMQQKYSLLLPLRTARVGPRLPENTWTYCKKCHRTKQMSKRI